MKKYIVIKNIEEVRYKAAMQSYVPKGLEVVMIKGKCTLRKVGIDT